MFSLPRKLLELWEGTYINPSHVKCVTIENFSASIWKVRVILTDNDVLTSHRLTSKDSAVKKAQSISDAVNRALGVGTPGPNTLAQPGKFELY